MWWEFLLLHTVISSVPTSHRTVYSLESKWWCTLNFSVWLHEIMFCSVLSVFFLAVVVVFAVFIPFPNGALHMSRIWSRKAAATLYEMRTCASLCLFFFANVWIYVYWESVKSALVHLFCRMVRTTMSLKWDCIQNVCSPLLLFLRCRCYGQQQ